MPGQPSGLRWWRRLIQAPLLTNAKAPYFYGAFSLALPRARCGRSTPAVATLAAHELYGNNLRTFIDFWRLKPILRANRRVMRSRDAPEMTVRAHAEPTFPPRSRKRSGTSNTASSAGRRADRRARSTTPSGASPTPQRAARRAARRRARSGRSASTTPSPTLGFLPAGRILAGAGTGRSVTLFNCFVLGSIEDDLGAIFEGVKDAALTMQQGGGIGHDFSTLRPQGCARRLASAPTPRARSASWTCGTPCAAPSCRRAPPRRHDGDAALRPSRHRDIHRRQVRPGAPAQLQSVGAGDGRVPRRRARRTRPWELKFGGKVYRTVARARCGSA